MNPKPRNLRVGLPLLGCLMLAVVVGCPSLSTEQTASIEQACMRYLQPLEGGDAPNEELISEVCSAIDNTSPPAQLLELGGRGCAFALDCLTDLRTPEILESNPIRLATCIAFRGGFCSYVRPISREALQLTFLNLTPVLTNPVCVIAEDGAIECWVQNSLGNSGEISCDGVLCASSDAAE